jgi:hypothetical protein
VSGGSAWCPTRLHPGPSPEAAEELADVADQQVGGFYGGEVSTPAELGPVPNLTVGVLPFSRNS